MHEVRIGDGGLVQPLIEEESKRVRPVLVRSFSRRNALVAGNRGFSFLGAIAHPGVASDVPGVGLASLDDPRPTPPARPSREDCCRGSCDPCVFDVYEDALNRYRSDLQAWEERQAPRKTDVP